MQPSPYATPGSIGATVRGGGKQDGGSVQRDGGQHDGGGAIWEEGEVSDQQHYEYSDPRSQPEYVLKSEVDR